MDQGKTSSLSGVRSADRVRARRGVTRWIQPSALAFGVVCAAAFGQGCGQAVDTVPSSSAQNPNADALSAVEGCQAQVRDCFASTDPAVCEEQLRACLLARLPEAGTPPPRPEHDGAAPPPRPEHDGAAPPPRPERDGGPDDDDSDGGKPPRDGGNPDPNPPRDGAPPDPPSHDAGGRSLPDAAKGALTDPVGPDGGPESLACVNELRACLATAARPSTCAEQSRACLSGGRDGG